MKRIRTLGIAAIAAFALTALVGVASASASWVVSDATHTDVVGTPTTLHTWNGELQCEGSELSASLSGSATKTVQTQASDDICSVWGEQDMEMNGCGFTFHPGAELSPGTFSGTYDIGPANCGPITVSYWGGACTISIYPKAGLAATYENTGTGSKASISVSANGSGLQSTDSCEATGTNGTHVGQWNLSGFSKGSQVGVRVEPTAPVGFYVLGEGAASAFKAFTYPVEVAGSQVAFNVFETAAGGFECEDVQLDGGAMSGPTDELALDPKYIGCLAFGLEATAKDNSCHYELDVTNSSPYSGSLDLVCSAGDQLEIEAIPGYYGESPFCTLSFPAQTLGSVTYQNGGSGTGHYVLASTTGAGLDYSVSGGEGFCGEEGSHEDGTFTGSSKLEAIG